MDNTRAILLMTGAMACFALVDTFVKLASRTLEAGQIIGLSSLVTFGVFTLWVWRDGGRLLSREALNPALLIRNTGEVIGSGTVGTGCGLETGRRLAPCDEFALTIEKIGTLTNRIVKR